MIRTVLTKELSLTWPMSMMLGEMVTEEKGTVTIYADTRIETTGFTSPDFLCSFIGKIIRANIIY